MCIRDRFRSGSAPVRNQYAVPLRDKPGGALRDPVRPTSCKHVLQGFRFSNSNQRVTQNCLDELEATKNGFSVGLNPVTHVSSKLEVKYRLSLKAPWQGPSPAEVCPAVPASASIPSPAVRQTVVSGHSGATATDARFPSARPIHPPEPWRLSSRSCGSQSQPP